MYCRYSKFWFPWLRKAVCETGHRSICFLLFAEDLASANLMNIWCHGTTMIGTGGKALKLSGNQIMAFLECNWPGPIVFYGWANEKRHCICNIFCHWSLKHYAVLADRKIENRLSWLPKGGEGGVGGSINTLSVLCLVCVLHELSLILVEYF